MAVSPNAMQEGNAGKPTTFSYAQAAKGKSQPASAPLKQVSTQDKESTSWADDLGDADTVLEEQQHNGTTNGTSESSEASVKSATTPSQADTAETSATASNISTPDYDSAATTVKDDSASPVGSRPVSSKGPDDEQKETECAGQTQVETGEHSSEANISRKASVAEDSKPTMKEAPPPAVNFWAARMAEASKNRPSLAAQLSQSGAGKGSSSLSNGVATSTGGRSSTKADAASQKPNDMSQQGWDVALPRASKSKTAPATRASPSGMPTRTNPLPPAKDSIAWPTPLTAQDTEKQKDQGKGHRPEEERNGSATSKSSSKNDWKKLDFTPSVVFESNVPAGGRGVPAGVRGGRGGGVSKRGGRPATGAPPSAYKPDQDGRSTQAASTKRLSSPSKTRNDVPASNLSRPAAITPTTSTMNGHAESESSEVEEKRAALPSHEVPSKPAADVTAATEANALEPQQNEMPADVPVTTQQEPANSRRGSLVPGAEDDSNRTAYVDRRRMAQTDGGRGGHETSSKRGKRTTPPQSRSRAQSQGYETYPFAGTSPYRGRGGRGGRGRGRGDFATSAQHPLPSLQTGAAAAKGTYPYMQSFSASPNSNRNWRASQRGSVPNDVSYGRFGSGYGPSDSYAMYPTGAYGYPGPPMSAMTYGAQMDPFIVSHAVEHQLSYYFSLENMLKDMFLRKHMDSQGFVLLNLVASFKKIRDLTQDLEFIKSICAQSQELELRSWPDGRACIRRRSDWQKWVLPFEDRDESARNDGPPLQQLPPPFQPHSALRSPNPYSNGLQYDGSEAAGFSSRPSPMQSSRPSFTSGYEPQSARGNRYSVPFFANGVPNFEPQQPMSAPQDDQRRNDNTFRDEQIPTLMVAVKKMGDHDTDANRQSLSNIGRTTSNGTLDTNVQQAGGDRSRSVQGIRGSETDRLLESSRRDKRSSRASRELYWLKDNDLEASELPEEGDTQPYIDIHSKALEARRQSSDECPFELQVLYQFWSHFLIRHFNNTMYNEFRQFAFEDLERGTSDTGFTHLMSYYHSALLNHRAISERVARHFVQAVQDERDHNGANGHALQTLRRAWRNGATNIKNRKIISDYIDADLRAELDR